MNLIRRYAYPLGLFLLALLVYANAADNKLLYSWDDNRYIEENVLVHTFDLKGIFTEYYFAAYLPVTLLSYALEYALWGMNPVGYHTVNVILHALNVVLVFALAQHLTAHRGVALVTALFFLVHPAQVETVAWVSQRKNLLSMLFFLLAWLAHIRSIKHGNRWLALAWGLFLLSLLSKQTAVGAAALFGLYDVFWAKKSLLVAVVRNTPYALFGLLGMYLILDAHQSGGGIKEPFGETLWENIQLNLWVTWDYLETLIAPFDIHSLYTYEIADVRAGNIQIWLGVGVLIGLLLIAVASGLRWLRERGAPAYGFFAVVWIVLFMLPVSNIVPIAIQRTDRYLYFPSIVIFMAVAQAGLWLWRRFPQPAVRYGLVGVAVAVWGIFAALTVQNNDVWQNSGVLWENHLRYHPDSETGILNRAVYYFREGEYDTAQAGFEELLTLYPRHYKANRFLGIIAESKSDYSLAVTYYEIAIRLQPNNNDLVPRLAETHYQIGRRTQEPAARLAAYNRALKLVESRNTDGIAILYRQINQTIDESAASPALGIAIFDIGLTSFERGNHPLALEYYALALPMVAPEHQAIVYNNIGYTQYHLGNYAESVAALQEAIRLNPEYLRAYVNLGNSAVNLPDYGLAQSAFIRVSDLGGEFDALSNSSYCLALSELGQATDDAAAYCERAIALEPENGLHQARLAALLSQQGRFPEALPIIQNALRMDTNSAFGWRVLGDVQAGLGESDAAREAYLQALTLNPDDRAAQEGLLNVGQ